MPTNGEANEGKYVFRVTPEFAGNRGICCFKFAKNEYSSYLIIDFNKVSAVVKSLFDDLMDLDLSKVVG